MVVRAVIWLEVKLLEMDVLKALVFLGSDFVSIHVHHFVFPRQDQNVDKKISRFENLLATDNSVL